MERFYKNILTLLLAYVTLFFAICCQPSSNGKDKNFVATDSSILIKNPLPSWNDPLKGEIMAFVDKVSRNGSSGFVPPEDRIATFDNDGTLWAEIPVVQGLFAFYRAWKMIKENPALAKKQPFLSVIKNDQAYFEKDEEKALWQLVVATHTGLTEDQFDSDVKDFFSTAIYPGRNVPVHQIIYKPQLELLAYLRANGFKTYIVTGGTIEFVRAISETYYGIPKDQVKGTTFKYEFIDSNRSIKRDPEINLVNDKAGKPVGIQVHIGRRPIFSAGNERSGGDIAMSKFCQSNHYSNFQLIVNHNDSAREYYYQEEDSASLKAAAQNKWHIVSMKDDWKTIF